MFITILALSSALFFLIIVSQRANTSIPIIDRVIRSQYLKSRFKIWDCLQKLEENNSEENTILNQVCFSYNKTKASLFYYLALLFKSDKDSFLLLNCDQETDYIKDELGYQQHQQKQKKVAIISMYGLVLLILTNIITAGIIFYISPEIFFSKADTYTETSQDQWQAGTASSTLSTTDSAGDITLAISKTEGYNLDFASAGVDVSVDTGSNNMAGRLSFSVPSDNGSIIAYSRNGNIYAQRVTSSGSLAWGSTPVVICDASGTQDFLTLISDGNDGAIMVWQDERNGGVDAYAQKINSSGVIQWTEDGVLATSSVSNSDYVALASDGNGGFYMAWIGDDEIVYLQKYNSSAVAQWSNPLELSPAPTGAASRYYEPMITTYTDGDENGVIVLFDYTPFSSANRLYVQKVDGDGNIQWIEGGILVGEDTEEYKRGFISDGDNGAYLGWLRGTTAYLQRIDSSGNLWSSDATTTAGYTLDLALGSSNDVIMVYDKSSDIYLQKYNSSGVAQWTEDKAIATTTDSETAARVMYNNSKIYVAWLYDDDSDDYDDIRYQVTDYDGVIQSTVNGLVVTNEDIVKNSTRIGLVPSTGTNGAILTFVTEPTGGTNEHIYAQKVSYYPALIYESSGVYTSPNIDASSSVAWNTLTPDETTPANTSISYETRTIGYDTSNKSLSGSVTASSEIDPSSTGGEEFPATEAIDGISFTDSSYTNSWISATAASEASPQWLMVDLGATTTVGYVEISSWNHPVMPSAYMFPTGYSVQVMGSSDWQDAVTATTVPTSTTFKAHSFSSVQTRQVRLVITEDNSTSANLGLGTLTAIDEFEIYEVDPSTVAWTSWEAVSGTTIASADGRYIQYRATLSTTDTSVTPTLSSVTIDYGSATPSDTTAPTISSVTPTAGNQEVSIDSNITVTFDENIATSTITTASLALSDGNNSVSGTASYANLVATFDPSNDLDCSREYTATVSTDVTDVASNNLASNYSWTFMTSCPSTPSTPSTSKATSTPDSTATSTEENIATSTPDSIATSTPEQVATSTEEIIATTPEIDESEETEDDNNEQGTENKEQEDDTPETSNDAKEEDNQEEGDDNEQEDSTEQENETEEGDDDNTEHRTESTEQGENSEESQSSDSNQINLGSTDDSQSGGMFSGDNIFANAISEMAKFTPAKLANFSPYTLVQKINLENIKDQPEFQEVGAVLGESVEVLEEIAQLEKIETTNVATVTTYTVVSVAVIAAQAGSVSNIPYLFINLFGIFAYRFNRRRKQGKVYDSTTGQPIAFARLAIYDNKGNLLETKITDKYGSYFFLVPKGEYTIKVQKNGYELVGEKDIEELATKYSNTYVKNKFLKFTKEDIINESVPVKPAKLSKLAQILSHAILSQILSLIFAIGLIMSLVMTIGNPSAFNYTITIIYLFLGALKYVNFAKPKWGTVVLNTGEKQSFAMVEVASKNAKQNILARAVTDEHGRYAFILDQGEYQFKTTTTNDKVSETKVKIKKRGVMGKNIVVG